MSANGTAVPEANEATQLLAEQMNRLRGRLLGMVEAVGFPARQEAGIKALLKSLTYDAQADLAETLSIPPTPLSSAVADIAQDALRALRSEDYSKVEALLELLAAVENGSTPVT